MSDTDLSPSWHRLASRLLGADGPDPMSGISAEADLFPGRHANSPEIAAETPIFHALTVGRRSARRERNLPGRLPAPRTDPLTEFRRDPLSAPIPVQVNSDPVAPQLHRSPASPSIALVSAAGEMHSRGRHHR